MTKKENHVSLAALDGVVSLLLAVFLLKPSFVSPHHLFIVFGNNVRAVDALFGVSFIFAWQYCFTVLHLYDPFAAIPSRFSAIGKGAGLMLLPLAAHLYFIHHGLFTWHALLRIFLVWFAYQLGRYAIFGYIADRIALRNPRRVLILGSGPRAIKAWREIRTRYNASINLLGFVDDREVADMPPDVACRYLGRIDDLGDVLVKKVVDVVLVAMPMQSCYPLMQRAVHEAEGAGVAVVYLNDVFTTRLRAASFNETILRDLLPQPERHFVFIMLKRLLDMVLAFIGIVVLSPLLVCLAIGVRLSSPGPIIFVQQRYGYRRRLFPMLKFRSMVVNAEALMPALESANELDGPIFKLSNDPRVTKFGKFLRSTSLDELPQLFNVLVGQMSLVGPRPMSIRDVGLMSEAALMRRFSVKPGMTGLWQVNGRSDVGFDQWVTMDNHYIDRWSLLLDFEILARTFVVIFRRSGAV